MSPIERSAGGGGSSAGGLVPLFDSGYLAASAATIDTGANGIAAGHFCLFILAYLRSTAAVTSDNVQGTFNNDASALYNASRIQNGGGAVSDGTAQLATSALLGNCPAASATAKIFGALQLTMPAYDGTSNFKAGVVGSGSAQDGLAGQNNSYIGISYESAAAISRMAIFPASGGASFLTGSRLVIYGTQ